MTTSESGEHQPPWDIQAAREMYNIAKAAEAGCEGNPHQYRDHVVPRPGYMRHGA